MTWHLRDVLWSRLRGSVLATAAIVFAGGMQAAVIAPGTPTSTVPTMLFDPLSSLAEPLPTGQFLLPIEITGASGLQSWSFDLTFDENVVAPVDAFGLYQWMYQSQFTSADPTLSDITSSGLHTFGSLEGIAGFSYGVSGDGLLAYILFDFLTGQENIDPGFGIVNVSLQQEVPEPGAGWLAVAALLALARSRRVQTGSERLS